jgi:PAS domain S-box-containing protein
MKRTTDPKAVLPAPKLLLPVPHSKQLELELYRRIFNSATDAIAIIDAHGYYLQQNPAHARLTGYSDTDLVNQTPALHLGKEAFARIGEELARKGSFYGELPIRNKQGEQRVVELSAFTMQGADGRVLCHVGVKRDVTERKRADAELKARLEQQAAVARLGQQALAGQELGALMQDAVSSVATRLQCDYGKLLELLPGGQQFLLRAGFGWKEGLVGCAIVDASSESQAGYTLHSSSPVVVENLASETRFQGTALLHEHQVASGMSVLVCVHGRPWGVLTTHSKQRRKFSEHDVNFLVAVSNVLAAAIERRQSEEALRQSEARFRRAQRAANLGAYEWDLRTDHVFWSEPLPGMEHLAKDQSFEAWIEHVHPEDRERVRGAINQALCDGSEFEISMRVTNQAGEMVWVATRGQAFMAGGRPVRVAGVIMDVTARKQAEEWLQRSEKLAMIGRLAASIAHEINNPLESVTNLLYLIERQPGLGSPAREYARLASEELSRVSHVSRQTLGFYRESSSAVAVSLSVLLDDVVRLCARKLHARRIVVRREYRLHQEVELYPNEIRQVFSNLLMNAFEASYEGGVIIVRTERAVDWRQPQVRGIRIVVADCGHGIAAQDFRRIFEPFFSTKGEKGTGLGLWVSKGLIQKREGSLRVRSSTHPERHGTVFTVFLPEAKAMSRAGEAPIRGRKENLTAGGAPQTEAAASD